MAIHQTYIFDDAINYTLSNTAIDSGLGIGKLSLVASPGAVKTNPLTVDTGFTYDSNKGEFASGLFRQKSQVPAGCLMATTFINENLNWALSGSLTGTLLGSATIAGGKLVCTGYANKAVRYDNAQITSITTQGCIRFRYTPNYTGIPSSDCSLFSIRRSSDDQNLITLSHSATAGRFYIATITSSTTVAFYNLLDGSGWLPTSGTSYEFEFNFNTVTGAFALFIDGVSVATRTIVYTRTGTADKLYIGAQGGVFTTANGSFDDVMIFNTVQHTAGYTPGYTAPVAIYPEVSASNSFSGTLPFNLTAATGIATVGETGSPRFTVNNKYWNGSAWAVSDGTYAQANDSGTMSTNIATLTVASLTLPWAIILPDSNTLCSLDSFSLTVTEQAYASEGHIEPNQPIEAGSLVSYEETGITDADTSIKACLKIDGNLKYWNGTAWVASNGTSAQANLAADFSTALAELDLGENSTVYVRWILSTSDTSKTPTLDSASINYNFGAVEPTIETCLVYGYVKNIQNKPVEGLEISIQLTSSTSLYREANSTVMFPSPIEVLTDADGYFETDLVWNSEYTETYKYSISMSKDGVKVNKNGSKELLFVVPDANVKDITDLLPTV